MVRFILHLDERPELPDGVAETLRQDGYQLLHTADPEEAMRLVEERHPALVLMEIELEGSAAAVGGVASAVCRASIH